MNNDDAMPTAIPQSAPHHSTTAAAIPSSSIVNPYLKKDETEIIPNSNDAANNAESPSSKKRNFITKYSHHRCSNNVPDVVTAAEIRRKRLRSIASSENDSCDADSGYNSLLLFRDHSAADGRCDMTNNKNSNDNAKKYAIPLDNDITEISGEGGSGKTQTCLSLALDCVTRRCDNNDNADTSIAATAVYITTKSSPATLASRLRNMLHTRLLNDMTSSYTDNNNNTPPTTADKMSAMIQSTLEHIYLIPTTNEEQLLDFITVSLEQLFTFHNDNDNTNNNNATKIGLIVLDDIASLYRFADAPLYDDDGVNNYHYTQTSSSSLRSSNAFVRERTGDLWRISSTLRHLAFRYSVPVIIVNQVTSAIQSLSLQPSYIHSLEHGGVLPALGLVWSHCVGMRVMLCKKSHRITESQNDRNNHGDDGTNDDTATSSVSMRYARVLQAVNVQEEEVGFVVEDGGVRWIRKGWR
eukprot:scaffold12733_cov74-Cyclotella_meneghiniana.AAC.3